MGIGAACLEDPGEYQTEYRARMTPQQQLRRLERRYAPPA